MLMLETYIQAEVLDIETKLSLCQIKFSDRFNIPNNTASSPTKHH